MYITLLRKREKVSESLWVLLAGIWLQGVGISFTLMGRSWMWKLQLTFSSSAKLCRAQRRG